MSQPIDPVAFGLLIQTLRTADGLKQFQLAVKAKLDVATLSHIERGRHLPRPEQLQKLCGALPSLKSALERLSSVETSSESLRG